jgi:hypothetical protein
MKVQAKLLCDVYQYEVIEESASYYIVYGTGGKVAVRKADYEPVEEWVDVTGMYGGIQVTVPGLEERQYRLVNSTGGYRLEERKRA